MLYFFGKVFQSVQHISSTRVKPLFVDAFYMIVKGRTFFSFMAADEKPSGTQSATPTLDLGGVSERYVIPMVTVVNGSGTEEKFKQHPFFPGF